MLEKWKFWACLLLLFIPSFCVFYFVLDPLIFKGTKDPEPLFRNIFFGKMIHYLFKLQFIQKSQRYFMSAVFTGILFGFMVAWYLTILIFTIHYWFTRRKLVITIRGGESTEEFANSDNEGSEEDGYCEQFDWTCPVWIFTTE